MASWTQSGKERVGLREQPWHVHTTACKAASQWGAAVSHRESGPVLCDHLEGWVGGDVCEGASSRGLCMCTCSWVMVVRQKLAPNYKAIIVQLKNNFKKLKSHSKTACLIHEWLLKKKCFICPFSKAICWILVYSFALSYTYLNIRE